MTDLSNSEEETELGMSRRTWLRSSVGLAAMCGALLASPVVADPRHCAEIVATLPKGHFFENVVADANGALYLTDVVGRGVYRYREGDGLRLLASLDNAPVGIELTTDGIVVSVVATDPTSGEPAEGRIVELSLSGEVVNSFAIPGSRFLNGIEALGDGRYLVAEAARGQIVEFDPTTNASSVWLEAPDLGVVDPASPQPGVNGLKRAGDTLWITSSQKALLLSVPIASPSSDSLERRAEDVVLDDIAVDDDGTIYATTHTERLLRFRPDMVVEEFADGAEHLAGITAAVISRIDGRKLLHVVGDGGVYMQGELEPAAVVRLVLEAAGDASCR